MKHFSKAKRLFAALLCLCMMVSVLPTTAFAGDAFYDVIELDFTSNNSSLKYETSSGGGYSAAALFGNATGSAVGDWVAFELGNVNEGKYTGTLSYTYAASGCLVDFYVVSKDVTDITAALTTDTFVGQADFCKNTGSTQYYAKDTLNVTISKNGEYYLVGKIAGGTPHGGTTYYYFPYFFRMASNDYAVTSYEFTASVDYNGDEKTNGWAAIDTMTYTTTHDYWIYHSKSSDCDVTFDPNANSNVARTSNSGFLLGLQNPGEWLALTLKVPASGLYKFSGLAYAYPAGGKNNLYLIPASVATNEAAIDAALTSDNMIAVLDSNSSRSMSNKPFTSDVVLDIPTAGEYVLVFECATTGDTYMYTLDFTRVGDTSYVAPEPPVNAGKFGSKGAYITEENGKYKVTFLSAIDSLEYKEVGFKVTVDGVEKDNIVTNNAYSSVVVNSAAKGNENVNAVDSFDVENGYVFLGSIDDISEGAEITFQPYAVSVNGKETIEGKAFEVTIQ